MDRVLCKTASIEATVVMHRRDHLRILHEFDVPCLEACLHHVVCDHVREDAFIGPDTIHDFEHLEDEIVLAQVISVFEHELEFFAVCHFDLRNAGDENR